MLPRMSMESQERRVVSGFTGILLTAVVCLRYGVRRLVQRVFDIASPKWKPQIISQRSQFLGLLLSDARLAGA